MRLPGLVLICVRASVCVCVYARVRVCVSVCVCERVRYEGGCMYVCVWM